MNVAVCIAPVTDPESVAFDIETETVKRGTIHGNPLDWVALAGAEAFLRAAGSGDLIALSVGNAEAELVLEEALVRGADRAVRIAVAGGADQPFGIALALAQAITALDCDLVLCGARSLDFGGEIVGAALATALGRPSVSRTVELHAIGPGRLRVAWKVEGGQREIYSLPLPAVISVEDELAEPGYVPVMGRQYRAGLNRSVEVIQVKTGTSENAVAQTYVQAKPRTKHAAAPTSYIGAVSADANASSAVLEFTDANAAQFLDQIEQWK